MVVTGHDETCMSDHGTFKDSIVRQVFPDCDLPCRLKQGCRMADDD